MKSRYILFLSYILTIIAVLILILRLFYPNHRVIAFTIYFISWIPFIYSIIKFNKVEKLIKKNKNKIKFIKKYRKYIINFIFLILVAYVLILLFPVDKFEYSGISDDELSNILNDDINKFNIYQKGQEDILILFQENNYILNKEFNDLTLEDKKVLISLWSSYLDYSKELDSLTQSHKYFYQLNYLKKPELNSKSFLVAYSSFISNYESFFILSELLNNSQSTKSLFNEENLELGIEKNSYIQMSANFIHVNNAVRLNIGQGNILFLEEFRNNISNSELDLIKFSKEKFSSINNLVDLDSKIVYETPLEYFEHNTFETWFPAQREIAKGIGHLKLSLREKYISIDTLEILKKDLEPGDIILQRREWQLTNVGIPGFWTHAAIYLGNKNELEKYFEDIISKEEFKVLINHSNSKFYNDYYNGDLSVIEALEDGVILNSIETSFKADYLGVLRANLSKEEKLDSVLKSISHYNKPYDYNFDFVTDNEVVCSELVFKAYHISNSTKGIPFELELTSGRLMLSPNNIVKQFDSNLYDENLEFVAFINYDGINSIFDTEENFRNSWKSD